METVFWWCFGERCIGSFRIDNVTPKSVLGVRVRPSRKTISYGRDVFLITRYDLFVWIRQSRFGKGPNWVGWIKLQTRFSKGAWRAKWFPKYSAFLSPVYSHDGASDSPTACHEDFGKEGTSSSGLRDSLTLAEVSSHNPWGKHAQTLTSTTCQRTSVASFSTTWCPSTESVNFGKLRILISRFLQMKSSTLATTLSCHFSQNLGNTHAHEFLTAEADSLPTDVMELHHGYGLVGCHSICEFTPEYTHRSIFDFGGNQMLLTEMDMPHSLKSNFARRQFSNRSLLIQILLQFAVESGDLDLIVDPFELITSCMHDTKTKQLVTRSGPPRLRCCVRHFHHKAAMHSLAAVRESFKIVLQHVCHFTVDVIAGNANAVAHKYCENLSVPRCARFLSCRHAKTLLK